MGVLIDLPGKPVASNYGLLWLIHGLLEGIVACYLRLCGLPQVDSRSLKMGLQSTALLAQLQ